MIWIVAAWITGTILTYCGMSKRLPDDGITQGVMLFTAIWWPITLPLFAAFAGIEYICKK